MTQSLATSRGQVTIRPATLADAANFRELRLFALQDSPTAFSADYQMNANQPISFWEGRLKPGELGEIYFAEHEAQLIGMCGIRKGETPKTSHNALIWGVFVRPEWRGVHVAEALIQACVGWAASRETEIVKLAVVTENPAAVRCYERCGFIIYGTEPHAIFVDGRYYDEHLMSRTISKT